MDIDSILLDRSLQDVIKTLETIANDAGNFVSIAGGDIDQGVASYLAWVDRVEHTLGSTIHWVAIEDLTRTAGYWSLNRPGGINVVRLLNSEVKQLDAALAALALQLKSEATRWKEAVVLVVADTNMYLDKDEPFELIDWSATVDMDVQVRVVVPLIVVHELDRLKRAGNNTTVKLAQAAIRWLSSNLAISGTEPSEPWKIGRHTATIEPFFNPGPPRPDDADGVVIQVARHLSWLSGARTYLVTKDLGMSLRATAAGVRVKYLEKHEVSSTSSVVRST